MRFLALLAFILVVLHGQIPPPDSSIRDSYTKYDYRIPMRDGIYLFTSVYIPKDVLSDAKTYPILLQRTPYSVAPYAADRYPNNLGPSPLFARDKFIFAYQDVRGRNMSEGSFTLTRPYKPNKQTPQDIDESSDAFDTIDWLIKHVPGNTGKVGIWGISQPGFFASASLIESHPALVAVSPQAPVSDYYLNDDSYHNGAFMLAHRFRFYQNFRQRSGNPAPPPPPLPSTSAPRTVTSSISTSAASPTPRRNTSSASNPSGPSIWTTPLTPTIGSPAPYGATIKPPSPPFSQSVAGTMLKTPSALSAPSTK